MNPLIKRLRTYPFTRLTKRLSGAQPPGHLPLIAMHIGEPRHSPPDFAAAILGQANGLSRYPSLIGSENLRQSCARALERRYQLALNSIDHNDMIVPVNGTREGLFSFVQAMCGEKPNPTVVMPNPFYQIYEGATILAGAQPYYLSTENQLSLAEQLDTVPSTVWSNCEILFICSPSNPSGICANSEDWSHALNLADRYNFIIAADECYADIFRGEHSPVGLLETCHQLGRDTLARCAVFHSLSKRSNLPGLRSGFIAASRNIVSSLRPYRDYHGCAMAQTTQEVSIAAWNNDDIPLQNRQLYDQKYQVFYETLASRWPLPPKPQGAFYLWLATPYDDREFSRDLFAQQHIKVLPGQYLAREFEGVNPGQGLVRISLVPSIADCQQAARRLAAFLSTLV